MPKKSSVRWIVVAGTFAIIGGGLVVTAQAPVQLTAQQDRQRIMDLLQIAAIPPGAPGSSNPETYNEANANPYPKLPDPLTLKNGRKVSSKDAWVKERRPEILEDFEREVYGRTPTVTPKVNWEVDQALAGGREVDAAGKAERRGPALSVARRNNRRPRLRHTFLPSVPRLLSHSVAGRFGGRRPKRR